MSNKPRSSVIQFLKALILSSTLGFGVSTFASSVFVYQAHLPIVQGTCQESAFQWAQTFARATGLSPFEVVCHGTVENGEIKVQQYLVSLKYLALVGSTPYSVQLGKRDVLSASFDEKPYYRQYEECVQDIEIQKAVYESQTGLVPVTVQCAIDRSQIEPAFYMQIDGFGIKPHPQPQKRLYTFTPHFMGAPQVQQSQSILKRLQSFQVEVAKWNDSQYSYYAPQAVAIEHDHLVSLNTLQQCESQINYVEEIYKKAGSTQAEVWCLPNRHEELTGYYSLEVLHEKAFSLWPTVGINAPIYYRFEDCLKSRELVLSDSRNVGFLGALCAPSLYRQGFELYFF